MSSYIEVKNVSKSFGGKAILQDVSLSIEQGTTVGLVGANGSGKSVLFNIGAVFMCAENSLVKMAATSPKVWEYLSIPPVLLAFTVVFKI